MDLLKRAQATRGIWENVVSPGHVYTAAKRNAGNAGIPVESYDAILWSIPLGRLGTTAEIAS